MGEQIQSSSERGRAAHRRAALMTALSRRPPEGEGQNGSESIIDTRHVEGAITTVLVICMHKKSYEETPNAQHPMQKDFVLS
jgi:hypothetical protein